MPSKPAKYGIKYWAIVDNDSLYVLNLDIYLGKNNQLIRKGSVGESVVTKLTEPFFYKERRVIVVDNFFSSVELAKVLFSKNLLLVGTLRKNKSEIPQNFLPKRTRTLFSSLFGFRQFLTIVSYVPKKNKSVILLSTKHHDKSINQSNSNKPDIIEFYNKNKGVSTRLTI